MRRLTDIETRHAESEGNSVNSGDPQQIDASETAETSDGQPLARKSGDGARQKFADHRESMLRTYRSTTHRIATTLYARDESTVTSNSNSISLPERAHTRMWLHHSGWYSDDTGRREKKDEIPLTQALADELPITNYEKQRALDIVLELNKLRFNRIGGTVAAILGTLAYVREESIANDRLHTADQEQLMELRIVDSDPYQNLCSQFGVSYHDALKKVKQAVG